MHSPATHLYRGYLIRRGGYQGTTDDRIDAWYIDHEDADTLDRRGPGYRTLADARTGIDRHKSYEDYTLTCINEPGSANLQDRIDRLIYGDSDNSDNSVT